MNGDVLKMAYNQYDNKENVTAVNGVTFNQFLSRIFMWMFIGLMITAGMALLTVSSPVILNLVFSNRFTFIALIIAEVALVISFSRSVLKASFGKAMGMFVAYALLNGVTISSILLVYTSESVVSTLGITAAMFGVMALYGMFTKTDLSPFRTFLFVGLFGVIILSVVNMFMNSSAVSYYISVAAVVIFAGLTAYDVQKMRSLYYYGYEKGISLQNLALMGALTLYLDFVNLFMNLMRLFGKRN